jgi:hypothetical protein
MIRGQDDMKKFMKKMYERIFRITILRLKIIIFKGNPEYKNFSTILNFVLLWFSVFAALHTNQN